VDEPGPGTLRLSVTGILTLFLAYSFRHPHFPPLHRPSRVGFSAVGTLPYHDAQASLRTVIPGFGVELAVPTIIGADALDW
jgi:hypothetical protein